MNFQKKILTLMIMLLAIFAMTISEVKAADFEVEIKLKGDTIVGGIHPRNIAQSNLLNDTFSLNFINNTSNVIFHRFIVSNAFNLDLNASKTLHNQPWRTFGGFGWGDTSPIDNSIYQLLSNSRSSDSGYLAVIKSSLNVAGPFQFDIYGDTNTSASSWDFDNVREAKVLVNSIATGDIGLDIRKSIDTSPLLGFTSILSGDPIIWLNQGQKIDGTGSDSDGTTPKTNGLVYYEKIKDFNTFELANRFNYTITHPDYEYAIKQDSRAYSPAVANSIFAVMRKLKFKIAGIEGNKTNLLATNYSNLNLIMEDTYGLGIANDLYYPIDNKDTTFYLYVAVTETANTGTPLTQQFESYVNDLDTSPIFWNIFYDTGTFYGDTLNITLVEFVENGVYRLTIKADEGDTWLSTIDELLANQNLNCTVTHQYYNIPTGLTAADSYYFDLQDAALNLIKIVNVELLTKSDTTSQPGNGVLNAPITVDLKNDSGSFLSTRVAFLSTLDTSYASNYYADSTYFDTLIYSFTNKAGNATSGGIVRDATPVFVSEHDDTAVGSYFTFYRSGYTGFDNSDPDTLFVYDTVVYRHTVRGNTVYILDANDSNIIGEKAQINVVDLACTTEIINYLHIDDDTESIMTLRLYNTGSETIGHFVFEFTDANNQPFGFAAHTAADSSFTYSLGGENSFDTVITDNKISFTGVGASDSIAVGSYIDFTFTLKGLNNYDTVVNILTTIRSYHTYDLVPDTRAYNAPALLQNDYLWDTYANNVNFEIHNLNCTVALSPNVIDDGNTTTVTFTIYNSNINSNESADSFRITIADTTGNIKILSVVSNSVDITDSNIVSDYATTADYINIKLNPASPLAAGASATITLNISVDNIVSGDSVFDVYLFSYGSADTINVVDTWHTQLKVLDLSCTMDIIVGQLHPVYGTVVFTDTTLINNSRGDSLYINVYNQAEAGKIDTFVITFPATFKDTVVVDAANIKVYSATNILVDPSPVTFDNTAYSITVDSSVLGGDKFLIIVPVTNITNCTGSFINQAFDLTIKRYHEDGQFDTILVSDTSVDDPSSNENLLNLLDIDFNVSVLSSTNWSDSEWIHFSVKLNNLTTAASDRISKLDIIAASPAANTIDSMIISHSHSAITFVDSSYTGNYDTFTVYLNANEMGASGDSILTIAYHLPKGVSGPITLHYLAYADRSDTEAFASDSKVITVYNSAWTAANVITPKIFEIKNDDERTISFTITNPSYSNGIDTVALVFNGPDAYDSVVFQFSAAQLSAMNAKMDSSPADIMENGNTYTLRIYSSTDTYLIGPRQSKTISFNVATYNISINELTSNFQVYLLKHDTIAGGAVRFDQVGSDSPLSEAWLFDSSNTIAIVIKTASVSNVTSHAISDSINITTANQMAWVGADLNLGSSSAGKDIIPYWNIHLVKTTGEVVAQLPISEVIHDTNSAGPIRYNFFVTLPYNGNNTSIDTMTPYRFRVTYVGQDGNFSAIDTSPASVQMYYYNMGFRSDSSITTIARAGTAAGTMQISVGALLDGLKTAYADTYGYANGDTGYVIKIQNASNTSIETTLVKVSVDSNALTTANDTIIAKIPALGGSITSGLYNVIVSYTKPHTKYTKSYTFANAIHIGNLTVADSTITFPFNTNLDTNQSAVKVGDTVTFTLTLSDSGLGIYSGGIRAADLGDTYTALDFSDSITRFVSFSGNVVTCTAVIGNEITGSTVVFIIKSTHGDTITVVSNIINIDTALPTLTISGINSNDSFGGATKIFTLAATDFGVDTRGIAKIAAYYRYNNDTDMLIDSATFANTDVVSWTATWNLTSLANDNDTGYIVYAKVWDKAGNETSTLIADTIGAIKIDRSAPVITYDVTMPNTGVQVVKNQAFVVSISDLSWVGSPILQISKNGDAVINYSTAFSSDSIISYDADSIARTDTYLFNLNIENGDWFYRVVAADVFNNLASKDWRFIRYYADTPTATNITVTYPTANGITQTAAKTGDMIIISAIVLNENDTKVELLIGPYDTSVLLNDAGIEGDSFASDKIYSVAIVVGDSIQFGDTVTLKVTNNNSDIFTYSLSVIVDTEIPYIGSSKIIGVTQGDTVTGAVQLKIASDENPINKVKYSYRKSTGDTTLIVEVNNTRDSALWQTNGIAEGYYTLIVEVWDMANNYACTEVTGVYVDNDKPIISSFSVTYPNENGIQQTAIKAGQSATVRVHVIDSTDTALPLASVIIVPDSSAQDTIPMIKALDDNVYSASIEAMLHVSMDSNGFYIIATNANGDTAKLSGLSVAVDTHISVPVFVAKDREDTMAGTIVYGISTSDTDIKLIKYHIAPSNLNLDTQSTILQITENVNDTFVIVTNDIPQGYYTFTVEVWDKANNYTYDTDMIFIDNSAPIVKITSPTAGAQVTGTVLVEFNVSDSNVIDTVWISINGSDTWLPITITANMITVDTSYIWNTIGDTYNMYNATLRIKAQDNKGNIGYSEIVNVEVNNLSPAGNISVQYPTGQTAAKNSDIVKITVEPFNSTDTKVEFLSTVGQYEMSDTGVSGDVTAGDRVYSFNIIVGTHLNAGNTAAIRLTNRNGNQYIYDVTIDIDNTISAVTFNGIATGDTVSNSSLFGVATADTDLQRVVYSGAATRSGVTMNFDIADRTDTNQISFVWPQIIGDGYCTITVKVYDKANNETQTSVVVYIDNTKPTVTTVSPTANTYLTGIIPVRFTATDVNIIKTVKFYVNGELKYQADTYLATSVNDTYLWDSSSDSRLQSNVTFKIVAIDTMNNENFVELPVFIDNSRPTVALLKPDTMTYIKGVYQVRSIASLADELWYRIVGTGVDTTYTVSPWSPDTYINFDSSSYPNGTYNITAIAKNSVSGNTTASSSMILIVDNNPAVFLDPIVVKPGPVVLTAGNYNAEVYRDWASISVNISDSNTEDLRVEVTSNAVIKSQYASMTSSATDSNIRVVANLEDGFNTITIKVTDKAGNISYKAIVLKYVQPNVTAVATTVSSTTVVSPTATDTTTANIVVAPDSSSVYIPLGAANTNVPITIKEISPSEVNLNEQASLASDSIVQLRVAREFGPSGTMFDKPVRIGIKYYETDLEELKVTFGDSFTENNLRIRYWNGQYYEDIRFDTVDVQNKIVYAFVNHFSVYVLAYDTRRSPSLNSKTVYVTKNPLVSNVTGLFDSNKGTTFKIDYNPNQVSQFTVEIFTLRGQRVASISKASNEVYWGGLSSSGGFIGTGLYIYKATVILTDGTVINSVKPIGLLKQ